MDGNLEREGLTIMHVLLIIMHVLFVCMYGSGLFWELGVPWVDQGN